VALGLWAFGMSSLLVNEGKDGLRQPVKE
jgi:hypothetical protein